MAIIVTRKPGESDDKLINRFRKASSDAGIVDEARRRKEHVPESQKRKEKKYRLAFMHKLARKRAKQL